MRFLVYAEIFPTLNTLNWMLRFGVCVDRSNFAFDVCIADIVMDFKFGLVFCIWQIYDPFGSRNTQNQLVIVMVVV